MTPENISKAKIKWMRSLQLKKNRESEGLFVAEGEKIVLEGLSECPDDLLMLVAHRDAQSLVPAFAIERTVIATTTELEQLSSLRTPNRLVAVFRKPAALSLKKGWLVALDGIQDPGNMGTIIRLADWFGVAGIVCSVNTVDCFNPKVIQASMGSSFRIGVHYTDLKSFFAESRLPVYGALLNGVSYSGVDYPEEGILLMGNEGSGVSDVLLPFITDKVTIPGYGKAESLNVATATAILLAEMRRHG